MANTKMNKSVHLDLFHEIKNNSFIAFQNLSNAFLDTQNLTEQEIKNLFLQHASSNNKNKDVSSLNEFVEWLLADARDSQGISLLKPDENTSNAYIPSVLSDDIEAMPIPVPYLLTIFEKRYLKTLLLDDSFASLLSHNTKDKLENLLQNVPPFEWETAIAFRGQESNNDLQNNDILEKLKVILEAMKLNKCIYCNNYARTKVYEEELIYPYRIMYSPISRQIQLIGTDANAKRIILLTIEKLSNIRIATKDNLNDEIFKSLIQKRKQDKQPIVLEIEAKNNAIERTFMQFSNIQKSSYYDNKRNLHVMSLYYYDFDEDDIITKILFLGDAITVISPIHIRQKIKDTINKTLQLYE